MQHPMNPGESREQYVARMELYAQLQAGLDDVAAGRVSDYHEFMADFWEERKHGLSIGHHG
ncbi:MAG: hypothetical protein FWD06_05200 [Oscillospiraceae bacterium]|nr:hypothetical protein [Oscillospiraceae bacterium]